ncbi:MAG: GAF domain-containing protein [bacterium]
MKEDALEKEGDLEKQIALLSILYSTAVWKIQGETEDEIMRIGLDRINEVLKPEIAAILALRDGFLRIVAGTGIPKGVCEKTKIEIGVGTCGEVFLTGRPIAIPSLSKDPSFIDPFVKEVPVKSVFCYPIRIEDSIVGVVWLGFLSSHPPLKEEEWLVSLVAERLALSLQIHRLKNL